MTGLSVGNSALCAAISPAAALIHPETDGRLLVRPQSRRRFLFWPKGPFWVGGGGGGYSSRLSAIEAEPPRLARSNQNSDKARVWRLVHVNRQVRVLVNPERRAGSS